MTPAARWSLVVRAQGSRAVPALLYIAVVLLPLLAPAFGAPPLNDGASPQEWWPSLRQWTLLAHSLGLALAVAAAGSGLALFLGSCIVSQPRLFLPPILAMLLVPPCVHSLAWTTAFSGLNHWAGRTIVVPGGWIVTWWVQTMTYLPFAGGLAAIGYLFVPRAAIEAARLRVDDGMVLRRILLPLLLPALGVSFMALFLMSILDYSVPSLFQVNVYALEIFSDYSARADAGRALALSLPLMLLTLLAAFVAVGLGRRAAVRRERQTTSWRLDLAFPGWFLFIRQVAVLVFALQIAVPLVSLIVEAGSPRTVIEATVAASRELATTAQVALLAAVLAVAGGYAIAARMYGPGRNRRVWLLLLVLPLAVPAPLTGVGLIAAWNRPLPIEVYGTLAMPVLAALARFLPWAALIIAAQMSRTDPLLMDAADTVRAGWFCRFRRITFPLLRPGFIAAFGTVLALTAGELGATLLVAPPGRATVTMRLYNYLHYGASGSVAGLALVVVFVTVAAEMLVLHAMTRKARVHAEG